MRMALRASRTGRGLPFVPFIKYIHTYIYIMNPKVWLILGIPLLSLIGVDGGRCSGAEDLLFISGCCIFQIYV